MNARDFLDVADELVMGPHESHWRSAVSRAYYAVFHVAATLLEQCGFAVPPADRAHAYLWMRLSKSIHPDVVEAGRRLDDLRRARNQADYGLRRPYAHAEAVGFVQRAADILRILEDAATMPTVLAQITQAMRDYERDVLQDVTWRRLLRPEQPGIR